MWFKKKKNALVFIWYILHFCFLGAAATLWNGTKTSQTLFSCCGKSLSGQCTLMWSEESEVALWQMDHWPVKDMLLVGSDSVASFRKKKTHLCGDVSLCSRVSGVSNELFVCMCLWCWLWLLWLDVALALLLTLRWRCVDSGWLMLTVVPSVLTC